ncbi:CvfB family protein [Anaerosacchariphilus polymeriproducens]|uniref:S1 RNA-binding domain-containing protein n=1 Tax=Anaerosacchariphilus polymeriproducens TaxID=1812858 RepID=A0A371ASZ5_9FIRM|nr:S1-like domain-containing RNA-binding protein [Anaerosacchariphilus polymeriproducens]RDU22693.1 S1 RNA-binding domain-containing protein [Anaerosacchariphilus polymeriproducens]
MIKLGMKQRLICTKSVDFGLYLAEKQDSEERVLLPKKQVPEGMKTGDEIEVFIYKDSKDRIIATTNEPKIALGELAVLEVIEVGKIGAFLDWGLEKDLLLPFKEQTKRVRQGEKYLVSLYIDKSNRLCATMKIYDFLRNDSPYNKDDQVQGIVYEISEEFGTFVAVEELYSGLIPKKEGNTGLQVGDIAEFRVTNVKEDGKLDLSIRKKAYLQMSEDAKTVMNAIEEYAGVLPFNDKAAPEIIQRELGLSKNAFKRAVGKLLKEGKIDISDKTIMKK